LTVETCESACILRGLCVDEVRHLEKYGCLAWKNT
jgi:hypothetical protein